MAQMLLSEVSSDGSQKVQKKCLLVQNEVNRCGNASVKGSCFQNETLRACLTTQILFKGVVWSCKSFKGVAQDQTSEARRQDVPCWRPKHTAARSCGMRTTSRLHRGSGEMWEAAEMHIEAPEICFASRQRRHVGGQARLSKATAAAPEPGAHLHP